MEYMKGISLQDLMDIGFERNGFSEKQILDEVIKAIKIIHTRGIGHYNLSPDNIYIDDTGVRFLDFGEAKYKMYQETGGGTVDYEEEYIAPEVLLGEKAGLNADLYSLGILEYKLYTGKTVPFSVRRYRQKNILKMENTKMKKNINILADPDSESRPKSIEEFYRMAEDIK